MGWVEAKEMRIGADAEYDEEVRKNFWRKEWDKNSYHLGSPP